MKRKCSVLGCLNPRLAKGLCSKHWNRQRAGKPLLTAKEQFIRDNPPKDGVGLVPLTQGHVAIVDAADYPMVIRKQWSVKPAEGGLLYAACSVPNGKTTTTMTLHRFILEASDGELIDHQNSNGLDNRKSNIRLATPLENSRNSRKLRKAPSRFKGVSRDSKSAQWRAQIRFKGKQRHLALCDSEEDAATYYDVAAQILFGPFAYTNAQHRLAMASAA